MTRLTLVCEHSKTLLRVIRLNGADCVLHTEYLWPKTGAPKGVERLYRLSECPNIFPQTDCCKQVIVKRSDIEQLLSEGQRRSLVTN